jgi:hypothetical protein
MNNAVDICALQISDILAYLDVQDYLFIFSMYYEKMAKYVRGKS